ncbi:MAG TPA: UBP-type zinc finger domain-containing protein [Solirubrobacterales bacterium]|nr:UBP-type zinc finger domain-containing protein [Solirubrobacterales bacterium]
MTCEHLDAIKRPAEPRAEACEECGATSSLRTCLVCGHVGCCDSRLGHATEHARASGHPVIRATPRGNGFTYCYPHRAYL